MTSPSFNSLPRGEWYQSQSMNVSEKYFSSSPAHKAAKIAVDEPMVEVEIEDSYKYGFDDEFYTVSPTGQVSQHRSSPRKPPKIDTAQSKRQTDHLSRDNSIVPETQVSQIVPESQSQPIMSSINQAKETSGRTSKPQLNSATKKSAVAPKVSSASEALKRQKYSAQNGGRSVSGSGSGRLVKLGIYQSLSASKVGPMQERPKPQFQKHKSQDTQADDERQYEIPCHEDERGSPPTKRKRGRPKTADEIQAVKAPAGTDRDDETHIRSMKRAKLDKTSDGDFVVTKPVVARDVKSEKASTRITRSKQSTANTVVTGLGDVKREKAAQETARDFVLESAKLEVSEESLEDFENSCVQYPEEGNMPKPCSGDTQDAAIELTEGESSSEDVENCNENLPMIQRTGHAVTDHEPLAHVDGFEIPVVPVAPRSGSVAKVLRRISKSAGSESVTSLPLTRKRMYPMSATKQKSLRAAHEMATNLEPDQQAVSHVSEAPAHLKVEDKEPESAASQLEAMLPPRPRQERDSTRRSGVEEKTASPSLSGHTNCTTPFDDQSPCAIGRGAVETLIIDVNDISPRKDPFMVAEARAKALDCVDHELPVSAFEDRLRGALDTDIPRPNAANASASLQVSLSSDSGQAIRKRISQTSDQVDPNGSPIAVEAVPREDTGGSVHREHSLLHYDADLLPGLAQSRKVQSAKALVPSKRLVAVHESVGTLDVAHIRLSPKFNSVAHGARSGNGSVQSKQDPFVMQDDIDNSGMRKKSETVKLLEHQAIGIHPPKRAHMGQGPSNPAATRFSAMQEASLAHSSKSKSATKTSKLLAQLRQETPKPRSPRRVQPQECEESNRDDKHGEGHVQAAVNQTDPDRTLVEEEAAVYYVDEDNTSSSEDESESSGYDVEAAPTPSIEQETDREEWQTSLASHQSSLLDALTHISHTLVRHLVEKETAIKDILEDYHQDGSRFIRATQTDHETAVLEYKDMVLKAHQTLCNGLVKSARQIEKDVKVVQRLRPDDGQAQQNDSTKLKRRLDKLAKLCA